MRVLIVGAGAIGSVVGGFLAKAGHDVTLLGRPWHLDVVRQRGLGITGIWGDHRLTKFTIATAPADIPHPKTYDWILVCVKAHQTAGTAEVISGWLGPSTLVCALQNGLGNYETLCARIPRNRVAIGRVIFGVEIEPGQVRVTVCADDVRVGAPDAGFPQERLEALAAALTQSGIPTQRAPNILQVLWAKVLYNCALNGLSTLLEVPYGKLLERETTRRLMEAILREGYQVAAAHRISLEPPTAQAYQELLFATLIPATAGHRASMLQDVRRGKPTEIDALNGAIVRLAEQAGVSAPTNAFVTRLVHAKEQFVSMAGAG